MCLWLLTACLGLLPANPVPPSNIVVVQGVPSPILLPTTAAPTTASVTNATTAMPTMMPTPAPTMMPTAAPTMMPTAAPTIAPTMMPTAAPTVTTAAPTTGNIPISPITEILTTASPIIIITNQLSQIPSVTNLPVATGVVSVLLCSNPDVICVSNPIDNTTGSLPIDPRLGTTPGISAQYQGPPITGYSAQIQTVDTAVKFPREKREAEYDRELSVNILKMRWRNIVEPHEIRKRQSCRCVPAGTCVRTTNGQGMIDIRIVTPVSQCPTGQEYCCGSTVNPIACGTLQTVPVTSVAPAAGQASFGEYPWQALILTKQNDYIAGGVLIDQLNVLTVTHRMTQYVVSGTAPNVKVRLGEWDAAGTYEPIPFQEYNVAKVFSHPSFNPGSLQYDLTVLRLASPVPFTPAPGSTTTINRACLPSSATATYTGQRCWVSGWGKEMFGLQGQYQNILKEVDVPIVSSATCQSQMQAARLGPTFVLDTTSFICAGGEANKDACTGDGGSGLVCNVNGQWVVVGLVAWGLGCANANVPGAYVNVAALLPWIQQQVATP